MRSAGSQNMEDTQETKNQETNGFRAINVSFGEAIEAAKKGSRIARKGWNGKGMFVYLNKGSKFTPGDAEACAHTGGVHPSLFEQGSEGTVTRMPNLNMHAADGSTVIGWLASQTDILAEDWTISE